MTQEFRTLPRNEQPKGQWATEAQGGSGMSKAVGQLLRTN